MFLFQLVFTFAVLLFVLLPMFGKLVDGYNSYLDNLLSGAYWAFKGVACILLATAFFWALDGVINGVLLG
jgi:hypothetical protein